MHKRNIVSSQLFSLKSVLLCCGEQSTANPMNCDQRSERRIIKSVSSPRVLSVLLPSAPMSCPETELQPRTSSFL